MELALDDELSAPLTVDELAELDRRVAGYEEDPTTGVALRKTRLTTSRRDEGRHPPCAGLRLQAGDGDEQVAGSAQSSSPSSAVHSLD
ncbi:MAG: hypothetical protein R3F39_08995 [Myxococcota bacterium]